MVAERQACGIALGNADPYIRKRTWLPQSPLSYVIIAEDARLHARAARVTAETSGAVDLALNALQAYEREPRHRLQFLAGN